MARTHGSYRRGSRAWQRASISAEMSTAASGRPAPKVFDSVRMSGTMASRENANISPVRPRPVCASSTISIMPRFSQRRLSSER
jgi:hypothetical protein